MNQFFSIISELKTTIQRKTDGYGRNIPIVSKQVYTSSISEKRFYLAALYFMVIPVLLNLVAGFGDVVFNGTGIALFYAQTTITLYLKTFYLSLIGQVLLVILVADQIAGEVEMKTFSMLRSKPIFDSEIVLGKFFGMMLLLVLLDLPALFIIYVYYLIVLKAEFPSAYIGTLDEIIGAIFFLLILQGVIVALTLLFSSLFNKSLYAILAGLLVLFLSSTISENILSGRKPGNVYISFLWLVDAFLPYIFYHLEPLEGTIPSLLTFLTSVIGIICILLFVTTLILRNKEVQ